MPAACPVPAGMAVGLALAATGFVAVQIPGLAGPLAAAIAIGVGVGLVTPLGFAHPLAPRQLGGWAAGRLGQTMGAAEVGRELGDVGGPMLVAALASIAGLGARAAGAGGRPTSSLAMRPPDNRRPEPYQLQTLHHRQQPDLRRPSGRRCRQPGAGPVACHLRRVRGRSIISSTTSSLAMVGDQAGAARPPCADVHPPHQLAALLRPLLRPAA